MTQTLSEQETGNRRKRGRIIRNVVRFSLTLFAPLLLTLLHLHVSEGFSNY